MNIKFLEGFQYVSADVESEPEHLFVDSDKIIQRISNGEVSIQARPEENLENPDSQTS